MSSGSEVYPDERLSLRDYVHPADIPPGFVPLTSPETPTSPFMSRGSYAFLLESPNQSTRSTSTYASPVDSYKVSSPMWAPSCYGIDAKSNLPWSNVVEQSDLTKGPGLNISSTSLPPNKPRPLRETWIRKLYMGKWSMVFLLALGISLAIGHHFFFKSLNGKEAKNQMHYTRIGSIFSISARSCLVVATILAYQQRAWMLVKGRVHSVRAIDTLFGAAKDFTHLMCLTMLKLDLACLILAIFIWISPLIIIFSADTLSIDLITKSMNTSCPSIRTLNFNLEGSNDWSHPQIAENQSRIGLSLSFWNATLQYADRNDSDPNFFDYWTGSSFQFSTVASTSLWGKRPMMWENASEEICGPGWNCSATVTFIAPGYKCTELANGTDDQIKDLYGQKPPFGLNQLAPRGNHTYIASAMEGAFPPQILKNVSKGGMPPDSYKPPYPPHLGAFRTDPVIWVGYTVVDDPLAKPPNRSDPKWNTTFNPVIFGCVHHRTRYTMKFTWIAAGAQTYEVLHREYLNKTIDTIYNPKNKTNDPKGTEDITHANPEDNYILPRDRFKYRVTGAYYSMGARLREMIDGNLILQGSIVSTQAVNTRLIDPHQWLPVKNLQRVLRDLYEDLIVSLINNPQFLVVSWASNPNKMTGVANNASSETNIRCERQLTTNCFVYHQEALWAVYTIGIAVTFIGVILGFIAASQDDRGGELREMDFSEIVSATRGQNLDEVRWDRHMHKEKVNVLYQEQPGDEAGKFVLMDG